MGIYYMEKNKMYVRLCKDLRDHGKLISSNESVYDHIQSKEKDYYVSVFDYNEEQKKQFGHQKQ